MLNKVGGGVEGHGMPPGYYLAILALTFWPGSLFLPEAIAGARFARAEKPVRFLICWALPVWLMFELIPTKLPHYTLPIFPALAILTAMAVTNTGAIADQFGRRWSQVWCGIWSLLGVALAVGLLGFHKTCRRGFRNRSRYIRACVHCRLRRAERDVSARTDTRHGSGADAAP